MFTEKSGLYTYTLVTKLANISQNRLLILPQARHPALSSGNVTKLNIRRLFTE